MRGDVIVAEFDTVALADTSSKPVPKRIVATGHASSYYQVPGESRVKTIPNINYVRGKAITVVFENREVRTVDVVEQAYGVYVEPAPASPTPTQPSATPPRTIRRTP
jgi:hypothetical protein